MTWNDRVGLPPGSLRGWCGESVVTSPTAARGGGTLHAMHRMQTDAGSRHIAWPRSRRRLTKWTGRSVARAIPRCARGNLSPVSAAANTVRTTNTAKPRKRSIKTLLQHLRDTPGRFHPHSACGSVAAAWLCLTDRMQRKIVVRPADTDATTRDFSVQSPFRWQQNFFQKICGKNSCRS